MISLASILILVHIGIGSAVWIPKTVLSGTTDGSGKCLVLSSVRKNISESGSLFEVARHISQEYGVNISAETIPEWCINAGFMNSNNCTRPQFVRVNLADATLEDVLEEIFLSVESPI